MMGLRSVVTNGNNVSDFFINLHRLVNHAENVELPRYNNAEINENMNLDLRIKYMLGEITVETFRTQLQQREKKQHKKQEIHQVLHMFIHTIGDMFRQAIIDSRYMEWIPELKALVDYFNTSMQKVSTKYDCVVPHVDLATNRFQTRHNNMQNRREERTT